MALETTQAWKDGILAQFRYPAHAKVVFNLVPEITTEECSVVASNTHELTVVDSIQQAEIPVYAPVATLEGTWKADGSQYLLSNTLAENLDLPWWAGDLVTLQEPIWLDIIFPTTVSIAGLTIDWDTMFNTWPTRVVVSGYDSEMETIDSYTFTDIHTVQSQLTCGFEYAQAVRISIEQWSNAQMRPRISSVMLGVILTVTDKDIIRIEDRTKISPISESLPVSNIQVTLKNLVYFGTPLNVATIESARSHMATDLARVLNGVTQTNGPVATVEVNYWKLDGTHRLMSADSALNVLDPWMSDTADFDDENPIEIILHLEGTPTVNRLKFTWDANTGSWPASFRVIGKLYDEEVFSNLYLGRSPESDLRETFGVIDELHVLIYTWSIPGWRARLTQLEIMYMYGNNYLPSEVNNLFDPTFGQGYSKYLAEHQRIEVHFGQELTPGTTTWLAPQLRFLRNWSIPADSAEATFEADTRLSALSAEYTKGTYTGVARSLYDVALEVLNNADVLMASDEPWIVPTTMQDFVTMAPIPAMETNSLLQLLAQAANHSLRSDPITDHIIFSYATAVSDYVLGRNQLLGDPHLEVRSSLRSLVVNVYSYTVSMDASEIFKSVMYLEGESTIRVKYSGDVFASDVTSTVTGGAISAATYYAQYADLTINAGVGAMVTVVLTGKVIVQSSTAVQYYHNAEALSGATVVVTNPFVTDTTTAASVASFIQWYFSSRKHVSNKYLGAPDLRAGDVMMMNSNYFNRLILLEEHELKFNGGYSGSFEAVIIEEMA